MFRKYQHIERMGTEETGGIDLGTCHIFYKIDGTNGSIWLEYDEIKAGSRNRTLSLESDNNDFLKHVKETPGYWDYLQEHPTHRLFGEWLVPHSLKTYRAEAWRKFYVFDVCTDVDEETVEYLPYEAYKPLLEKHGILYIPPLAVIKNPDYESIMRCLEKSGQFLTEDGKGIGEGIVIKNYDYYNRFKRQTWAKVVCNEFKEKHAKEMGVDVTNGKQLVEETIVDKYCSPHLVEKEYAKIVSETGGWRSQYIPRLLMTVFYTLVTEECWNFVKEFKQPRVDFKRLNQLSIRKVKELKPEIFC